MLNVGDTYVADDEGEGKRDTTTTSGRAAPARRRLDGSASGYVMDDTTIRTAVTAWLDDAAVAEATYGHISTWDTADVVDMEKLFHFSTDFNEDIGAWNTSSVTKFDSLICGVTLSVMRPGGAVEVDGKRIDAVATNGQWVEAGVHIHIVDVQTNNIFVEPVKQLETASASEGDAT